MASGAPIPRQQLERLYESLGPRLLLYLQRRTGDPVLAADIVQEVFLRLLEAPIRADSAAEVRSYLYRAAQSRLIDRLRRRQRERLFQWRPWSEPTVETPDATDFERVFRSLKPRESLLLWLAYVEEMNHNEIAEIVGVQAGSVKVLLFRARHLLRAAITRKGLAPEGAV